MYPEKKTVVLQLGHTDEIDLSIEAVQRALDGKPARGVDVAPLMGVISILEAIRGESASRGTLGVRLRAERDSLHSVVRGANRKEQIMKTTTKTVDEILKTEDSPLPLAVIPNNMGINLCSVEALTWTCQDDGQLVSLTIHFLPTPNVKHEAEAERR